MEHQPRLFSMVRCRAYMMKAKDTVHIEMFEKDGTRVDGKVVRSYGCKAYAYKLDPKTYEGVEIADLSEFCGQSVEKTYRVRKEELFTGCVVGYTRLKVKGIIGTDWNDSPYGGDFGFCFKQTTENPKAAVVYFKNNSKRYVLLDDLEPIGEGSLT